jgi:site-specific recombinase XerD
MHWLQNGGSIEGLSKNLAHASVTTTEIYGEILDERAREEYEQYAPDIDLNL